VQGPPRGCRSSPRFLEYCAVGTLNDCFSIHAIETEERRLQRITITGSGQYGRVSMLTSFFDYTTRATDLERISRKSSECLVLETLLRDAIAIAPSAIHLGPAIDHAGSNQLSLRQAFGVAYCTVRLLLNRHSSHTNEPRSQIGGLPYYCWLVLSKALYDTIPKLCEGFTCFRGQNVGSVSSTVDECSNASRLADP